jgi:hypothetical protein
MFPARPARKSQTKQGKFPAGMFPQKRKESGRMELKNVVVVTSWILLLAIYYAGRRISEQLSKMERTLHRIDEDQKKTLSEVLMLLDEFKYCGLPKQEDDKGENYSPPENTL